MLDILGPSAAPLLTTQFNARVDADSIMASLARDTGMTLSKARACIMYAPHDRIVFRKPMGSVRLASGIVVNADQFFKITPWQDDYARRVCKFLTHELHHDGCWATLWCNPTTEGYATEIRFCFQDKDGDIQFSVASDLTLVDLQAKDDHRRHGNVCQRAYEQWRETMEEVGVRPENTIKAAQGQRQKDPSVQPII